MCSFMDYEELDGYHIITRMVGGIGTKNMCSLIAKCTLSVEANES